MVLMMLLVRRKAVMGNLKVEGWLCWLGWALNRRIGIQRDAWTDLTKVPWSPSAKRLGRNDFRLEKIGILGQLASEMGEEALLNCEDLAREDQLTAATASCAAVSLRDTPLT
jgi:hypothetical protein